MLQIFNVWKLYGSLAALQDISVNIPDGEIWALTGHNGAGKTTLLKMIAGLLQPDQGNLDWGPYSPVHQPEAFKELVHYVPQKAGLYPNLTVGETMQFFAKLRQAGNLTEVMKRFDLLNLKDRLLRTLSGGQKQRVIVAQAFLGKGQFLLLDEPTTNLDLENVDRVKQEFRRFACEGGTVIISSHIADDLAAGLIDHRVVMEKGSIVDVISE